MPADTTDRSKTFALALLASVQFIVVLDASIVNVALPSIGKDLNFSQDDLSWVVNAYVLVFGGFLLLGGRMADLLGRRRMFISGLILFGVASLAGGLAQSDIQLIVARAFQGLGAAIVSPAALSIVTNTFKEGAERNKALGVWGAVAGSGGAAGVLLGGVLTEYLGWEWVLFVNTPITLFAAFLAPRLLDESLDRQAGTFDIPGAVTVTAGLSILVYALVDAESAGWGSTQTIALLALAVALLVSFVLIELRTEKPLMPFSIFRLRDAARVERRRAADRHVAVLDVLLHLALPPAGAGLRAAEGGPRLPAAVGHDHRERGHRVGAGHEDRLQAGARHRAAVRRGGHVLVLERLAGRQLPRRRAVPVAARRGRARASRS